MILEKPKWFGKSSLEIFRKKFFNQSLWSLLIPGLLGKLFCLDMSAKVGLFIDLKSLRNTSDDENM